MKFKQYVRKGSFYSAVVEDGSDMIFIVDFEGNIHYHNSSVRGTLGYRAKSLTGRNFFEYIPTGAVGDLKKKYRLNQKRAYTEKVEIQFLCSDRSYKFLEFNAINLKHKVGLDGYILDCRDITQRKRDAEELVRLQKAKEQFLANISHEIRTPINGIAGMAGLLSQESTPEERATYLMAIKHSAENLKVIINDILDLAAIESGKLRFEKIPFSLRDLLPSLIGMFAYQAKEKKILLDHKVHPSLNRIILGDPVRLNQILINLISNAVKFTHSGQIQIRCSAEKKTKSGCIVKIQVIDTGVGVPSDKLETIFESFSQADASVTRNYGGSGLGLTIVKQLVELQNGTIELKSEERKGSNFIVRIPYSFGKSERLKKTSIRKTMDVLDNKMLKELKVLLVEDNDINRLYAKSILHQWNCSVDIAENGLVAIEKIKNHFYDVVLMDVQMPVMDGYEATRAIRLMDSHKRHVLIIALTANATKTDIQKCLSSGMNDYLPKPFTPDDLYRKIFRNPAIKKLNENPADTAQPSHQATFDLTYLRRISDNNQDFLQEMVQTFIQSIPPVLNEMNQALSEKNWQRLSRLAHQIKPSFSLMGMEALRKTILYIETNAEKSNASENFALTTQRFIEDCKKTIIDLKKELIRV
jgi:PAS domain S-box-containing protein